MTTYSYEINMYHPSLGEIYDENGKWYNTLEYCENNLLKRLNSNKFKNDMIENDVGVNCYADIYIITNEQILNNNQYFPTNYRIIKKIQKIIYDTCDGFEKIIDNTDLLLI